MIKIYFVADIISLRKIFHAMVRMMVVYKASPTGGTQPYAYSWTNSMQTPICTTAVASDLQQILIRF